MKILRILLGCLLLAAPCRAAEADPLSAEKRAAMTETWKREVADATARLASHPDSIAAFSARGDALLFLGDWKGAVADFEKMIALDPEQDARHWRLGIAYYFAGDFAKSARQFAKYHAYDGRDRENGIWKFLAQARVDGVEKARKEMLVYTRFDREPFPTLYEVFAGKKTPDEMFAEIEKNNLTKDDTVMFFAHYYGGLAEQLRGNPTRALELLQKAVASPLGQASPGGPSYMWQVARLHWEQARAAKAAKQPASTPDPHPQMR